MSHSATDITNLLYRYAELMDAGDLEAVAGMFENAMVKTGDGLLGRQQLLEQWRKWVKIYPDGTPQTKHIITNPIVEINDTAGTARCRSCYTVLQATDTLPLQVIAAGRYHDTFKRVDGEWGFNYRDYTMLDLKGDLSDHLRILVS